MLSHQLNLVKTIYKTISYVWNQSGRIKLYIISAFILTILASIFSIFVPLVLKAIINYITDPTTRYQFIAILFISAYGLCWIVGQLLSHLRQIFLFFVTERAIHTLTLQVFTHLHALPLKFHTEKKMGTIVSAIERAEISLPNICLNLLFFIMPVILEICISTAILWYLYGIKYGAILIAIFFIYVAFSIWSTKWTVEVQKECNKQRAEANAFLVDSLLNFETVKYFTNHEFEKNKYDAILNGRRKAVIKYRVLTQVTLLIQALLVGTSLSILTIIAGKAFLLKQLQISDFILINGYLLQFIGPLSTFGLIFRDVSRNINELAQVLDLLKLEPEVCYLPVKPPTKIFSKAEIVFDQVKFGYDSHRAILDNISFTIPTGKTVAIVGSTGSGKSTIAKLLFGFYNIDSGRILINNQNISTLDLVLLRSMISVVPQESCLFNDSIRNNIWYGNLNANETHINNTTHAVLMNSLLTMLPDGLNTFVGERGIRLSGGEKQKIAIARILLKKSSIFILDEATSSLDARTEKLIYTNFIKATEGATKLIIAHRLSTITDADEIIVLDQGRVVEQGSHCMLIKKNGLYAHLWAAQNYNSFITNKV